MSEIAALARAERAFAKPTLSLLARKNAPIVVAVFSLVFRAHVSNAEVSTLFTAQVLSSK